MSKQTYKNYYVIGFKSQTIFQAEVLTAFASTGNGKSQLDEMRSIHKGKFYSFSLVEVKADNRDFMFEAEGK